MMRSRSRCDCAPKLPWSDIASSSSRPCTPLQPKIIVNNLHFPLKVEVSNQLILHFSYRKPTTECSPVMMSAPQHCIHLKVIQLRAPPSTAPTRRSRSTSRTRTSSSATSLMPRCQGVNCEGEHL